MDRLKKGRALLFVGILAITLLAFSHTAFAVTNEEWNPTWTDCQKLFHFSNYIYTSWYASDHFTINSWAVSGATSEGKYPACQAVNFAGMYWTVQDSTHPCKSGSLVTPYPIGQYKGSSLSLYYYCNGVKWSVHEGDYLTVTVKLYYIFWSSVSTHYFQVY
jgi:hypothetical protein